LGLLLSIAVFAPHALSDDKVIPKNGCGIDWKTVDQAKVKVKLSNGEEVTSQPTWAAFGPADVVYYGYDVKLKQKVTVNGVTKDTIRVWVLPKDKPANRTQAEWENFTYWCHGLTFDDNIYSPGGNEVPFILAAGYEALPNCEKIKKDEIIVFSDAAGNVLHSAVSNGDGTFRTKNGANEPSNNATQAQLEAVYGVHIKCYKCK
jgi:hypothetical protein